MNIDFITSRIVIDSMHSSMASSCAAPLTVDRARFLDDGDQVRGVEVGSNIAVLIHLLVSYKFTVLSAKVL